MNVNRETFNRFVRRITLISSFIFLSSSFCYAGIYKWVDAEGNVHYGQQRPANAPSERLEVQQYAPQNTSSYKRPGEKRPAGKTANGQTTEKKKQTPVKKKETRAEKKERLASCKKTRKTLSTMESIGRIRVRDKDGNMTYMSQKKKEADMKKARDLISKHCN